MISILCPTRKRVDGLNRMMDSALKTSSLPLEFCLYVDYDDEETLGFLSKSFGIAYKVSTKEKKEIYSNLHNICASISSHDILFLAADDIIFRTQGWDEQIVNAFEYLPDDKIGFVFPNDGHWYDKLGTHGAIHRNWVNALGYINPPIFTVDYSDNYINDLAESLGRRFYLDSVLVEHMHWTFNKSAFDETAQEAHARRASTNNGDIYRTFGSEQLTNDKYRLKKFIEGYNENTNSL